MFIYNYAKEPIEQLELALGQLFYFYCFNLFNCHFLIYATIKVISEGFKQKLDSNVDSMNFGRS